MYLISMVMTTNKWIALGVVVVVVVAAAALWMRSRRASA